jgi:hypothetical protein
VGTAYRPAPVVVPLRGEWMDTRGRAAHAPRAPDEGCDRPSYRTDTTADESPSLR